MQATYFVVWNSNAGEPPVHELRSPVTPNSSIVSNFLSITLQNDLEEFFAMVNFTNPGILGDVTHFRRYYEVT